MNSALQEALWFRTALGQGLLLLVLSWSLSPLHADEFEFFEKRIRPVLVERCYKCHSAESEKLKGSLRLDTKEGMLQGGESGRPAIMPGDAEKSLLIEAIRYKNEELQMPPPKGGEKLNDQQLADFVAWVNAGAFDPRTNSAARPASPSTFNTPVLRSSTAPVLRSSSTAEGGEGGHPSTKTHWAFLPPKERPIPDVKSKSWCLSPIDRFILAKLEEKELKPSASADKRTLIRRATFDLTGVPPTSEEVQAFEQDTSRDAFVRVVDRLLGSPRYGERWGRYWLDVARYSDTKGYVYDREEKRFVHSHVYRDWVIRAFNDDLPYDQFLIQQIAADHLNSTIHTLPPTSHDALAAMGFLTIGRRFLGVMHDIIDDRIDVLTRGTMGLTVGCARCHDHKFDPVPTKDYYSLYSVFYNSTEQTVPLYAKPARTKEYEEYEKGLREREAKLDKTFQVKRNELTDRLRAKVADYLIAVLDVAKLPSEEFYAIMGPDDLNPIIVRQWEAYLYKTREKFHPVFTPWHEFAKLAEKDFAAKSAELYQKLVSEQDPRFRVGPLVLQALSVPPPASMREVAQRYAKLFVEVNKNWKEAVNLAATNKTAAPTTLDPNQEPIRQVLYGPDSPAHVPSGAMVDMEWFFDENTRVELAKLHAEIDRWIIKSPGAPPHAVVLADRPALRNARVFIRGNPANKGEEVPRQFLEVLSRGKRRPFELGSGRLELAQAIASRDNPLTARVMVNRIWLHHFGAGLVRTPSDFGTRCEPPSHPELLDWLALRFMDGGWSIKQMHRLMMLSSVYQQSSHERVGGRESTAVELRSQRRVGRSVPLSQRSPNAWVAAARQGRLALPENPNSMAVGRESPRVLTVSTKSRGKGFDPGATGISLSQQVDPENRLLWCMNRPRLDFESMRDSLLAVSGELDLKMGGKPIELLPFSPRRTVYGFIDRQFLPDMLRVFDFANPDMHSPLRHTTTVPQQALFFMNNPFVVERARTLARRKELMNSTPEKRIQRLYEWLYQRQPTALQIQAGLRFLQDAEMAPPPEPPKPIITVWQYGYGEFDEGSKRLKTFEPLPHFTGDAWQGGPNWPDAKLGWVQLTAEGGHAGNDLQHAVIRRWVAPRDGVAAISGSVQHEHPEGDGIRAFIVSSRSGLLGSWTLHNQKQEAKVESVAIQKGDTLDLVVDYRANLNSDDFKWVPVIRWVSPVTSDTANEYATEWNAKKEFSGPPALPPKPLDAWEKYAQVLLLSNEFMFVD